ncbi:ATP-binding cassette domain-containing protein [Mucilaginibacter sp. SG564]|uniref:ABC transporter ATP-binding protein n=1 Tax=Mucilaginibacter sp. SG564 TaxID=2587022 RepID=UPI001552908A|nr:ABC transporter ATP-binding protein [Mucilaginibacter sp. SG564]NOW94320.1 ABC-2 type transport system ATP-binding protein [Mucilaginibacter sp. SG564]
MIVIKDLTYGYHSRDTLFQELNLTLPPGRVYGLLGKNGAGKSSLIKNMAGLVFPQKGSCTINGLEARHRRPEFLAQLYFIPEECELPPVTIPVFLRIYSVFYRCFDETSFYEYLRIFNVPEKCQLHKLSFGQKKKIHIAFALAANTDVLIMDEPTNGLDIPSKTEFREIIARTRRYDKITIMSTHQVKDLDGLIDSVIIIDQGRVLLAADKEEIGQKLSFSAKRAGDDTIIYGIDAPGGRMTVSRNTGAETSTLDLELLFNAAIYNPSGIRAVFQTQ